TDVQIGAGSLVENSVILPGASVGDNASLEYVIVAENVKIAEGVTLSGTAEDILLIDKNVSK
ncbi:GlgC family sugar phosphate nucleotidyltransferase, partial [Streptococcus pyogenes]